MRQTRVLLLAGLAVGMGLVACTDRNSGDAASVDVGNPTDGAADAPDHTAPQDASDGAITPDGTNAGDTGPFTDGAITPDGTNAGDTGPFTDGATDDVALGATINLAGIPQALASNGTTLQLYVSLSTPVDGGGIGPGAGIAVIDETTTTVTSTIAPPPSTTTAGAAVLGSLVIDETANKIYAAAAFNDVGNIRVYDGVTHVLTTIAPSGCAFGVEALAVDSAAHRLYAWVDGSSPQYSIGVWDTTTNMPIATIPITDMSGGSNDAIALDPTNHRLFVCGFPTLMSAGAAYDTIDTTMNTIVGAQHTFDASAQGYFVDCQAGPGYAALITNGTMSNPAVLEELEPAHLPLSGSLRGFEPSSFVIVPVGTMGDHYVSMIGTNSASQREEVTAYVVGETVRSWGHGEPGFLGAQSPFRGAARLDVTSDSVFIYLATAGSSGPNPAVQEIVINVPTP